MKSLRYAIPLLFIFVPLFASAQSIPAFPMALWGNVTINGSAAPVGTIVRAYYGSTLAGQVTAQDAGIYGYTEPTKQKLVIGQGTGAITFTVQSSSFNSGAETGGTTAITYPQFTSGSTTQDDLAFTISIPTPTPPSSGGGGGSSGGGGGGGGGGSVTYSYGLTINGGAATIATTAVTLTITPASNSSQMWISNDPSFSIGSWIPFQNTYAWTLTSGAGIKTVYMRYGSASSTIASAQTSIQLTAGTTSSTPAPVSAGTTTGFVLGASAYNFTKTLQIGSKGIDVTQLQQILIDAGILSIGTPTGTYGPLTAAAVKAFQKAHGLAQVGVVGPQTRAVLNNGTTPASTTSSSSGKQTLTDAQIQSVIQLLQAFDVDTATINNVNAVLHGR